MKRYMKSGVSKDFAIDYAYNTPDDIITFVELQIYNGPFGDNTYWFGYTFNADVDSKTRTAFIHHIKQLGDNPISDRELRQFIERPLGYLSRQINLYKLDALIHPISNRSPLVQKIIECIGDMTGHDTSRTSFELIKAMPSDIQFDWDKFEADRGHLKQSYSDAKKYIEEVLLPRIHDQTYFSIASSVPAKYRTYIQNYLSFRSAKEEERFSKLTAASNILVVDDINTSGATLYEILRLARQVNNTANIFVYTLIGR